MLGNGRKIFQFLAICLFFLSVTEVYSSSFDFTKTILEDDYDENEDGKGIYSLNVKGTAVKTVYYVLKQDKHNYLPVLSFFHSIGFRNYEYQDGKLEFILGNISEPGEINVTKENIKSKNMSRKLEKKDYILQDEDIYLEESIFKNIFARDIYIDNEKHSISISPSFSTPRDIEFQLANTEKSLQEISEKEVLLFKNERRLFELGNVRLELDGKLEDGLGSTKKTDWDGRVEYQGDLLYGTLLTSYDLKESEIGNVELYYPDVYGNHSLKMGVYGDRREKGLTFRKEKGFYEDGANFIINETVPLGSRIVLTYNGMPIEVKYEENSEVTFSNPIIREGRTFVLKIYTPDGKVYDKVIKTNRDYDQQLAGAWGYDVDIREDKDASKYDGNINIYRGITDRLTLGLGYSQTPEYSEKSGYSRGISGDLIYSNTIFENPYTLKYIGEYYLNEDNNYTNSILGDINIGNLSISGESREFGKAHDTKREQYLSLEYDFNSYVSVFYDYERHYNYITEMTDSYEVGVQVSNSWKQILMDFEVRHNRDGEREYDLNFYYSGFDKWITRLNNSFDEKGRYEVAFALDNKQWDRSIDYSLKVEYSDKNKEKLTFDFILKVDNWFEIGSYIEKGGKGNVRAGIDTVVNLKQPLKRLDNLESSQVEVLTFIDENGDNKKDENEPVAPGIDVKMGEHTIQTDEDGKGYFYGIPNHVEHELELKSNRPMLSTDKNIVKVKGKGISTIKAHIPVKPMVSLVGKVNLELKDSLKNSSDIYKNIEVRIYDENMKFLQGFYCEMDGEFYMSDLNPGEYIVELRYSGNDYKSDIKKENVKLVYDKPGGENTFDFNMNLLKIRGIGDE